MLVEELKVKIAKRKKQNITQFTDKNTVTNKENGSNVKITCGISYYYKV